MPVLEILRKVTKSKHVKIISFANNLVENIIIKGVSSLQSNKTIKHLRINLTSNEYELPEETQNLLTIIKPGVLQSIGFQRVRHGCTTKQQEAEVDMDRKTQFLKISFLKLKCRFTAL